MTLLSILCVSLY